VSGGKEKGKKKTKKCGDRWRVCAEEKERKKISLSLKS
jgi:hypothetical protein